MSQSLNPIQQLGRLGQSVWYDNMYRALIDTGELQRLIESGVTGLTSNPTIFEKAISSSDDYDESLVAHARRSDDPQDLFEGLAVEDIRAAADLLLPIYERTEGADGFASLEVNPHLAHNTKGTIKAARRLFLALDRPNVMIKVPATPEGIPAIRDLIGRGINVNVTLIFSLEMYARVRDAYVAGLEDLIASGGDPARVSSVASFFVSRVDTSVDGLIGESGGALDEYAGKAAVANAKIAYQDFKSTFSTGRFRAVAERGARVQRPLWASTSTKNPEYSDVLYVETLIGPHTVNTMPDATLAAFMEHGTARTSIEEGADEAREVISALETGGISMEAVTTQLMHDGVKAFADSFDELLDNIVAKRDKLLSKLAAPAGASLGKALATADEAVASLQDSDTVARIWSGDHTLWSSKPTEIMDRLGWLDVPSLMLDCVDELIEFAREIRDEGTRHVVLLGMGGSSLGAEVLGQCAESPSSLAGEGRVEGDSNFHPNPNPLPEGEGTSTYHPHLNPLPSRERRIIEGWPELIVLDSTIPARIASVVESIDPARTLFLVSSKSGTTIEPNMLYKFFRSVVEDVVGAENAGNRFVAITDDGTALDELAQEDGFRRVFRNRPDIGGRYSVLSYFGLVPAALVGFEVRRLLNSAVAMQGACGVSVPVSAHPGAWFGAVLGALALKGRDKLTILTSPSLSSFGLWAEQLVAESLGKDGMGIVPIAGEPVENLGRVGDDRMFVSLELAGDDAEVGALANRLVSDGHPVVRYRIDNVSELGGEFYRWQFAIAVAGAVMGVHPFDQPDVQRAKDLTDEALARFKSHGEAPTLVSTGSGEELVSSMGPEEYFAILVYLEQTPELDAALDELRSVIASKYSVPTTVGYGPRYLHSTGQLHKGGANKVVALMLAAPHAQDVDIPGESFSFGVLADAQASSDLEALRSAGRSVGCVVFEDAESGASGIKALANNL